MGNATNGLEIPKVCRAAVCRNRGPNYHIECVRDYPVPEPGYGELLVKIVATGLCSSDHHYMLEDLGPKLAEGVDCPGHEGSGVVVALGAGVDERLWKIGDKAGIKPSWDSCRYCEWCRSGQENMCDTLKNTGADINGSYCQYVRVPAHSAPRIPDSLPHELAGPLLCSGGTVLSALKTSGARPGQWIVIPGAGGGVGSMAVQFAKALALRVIAIDGGEAKRKVCLDLGAEAFIDFTTSKDVFAESKNITGSGAHAVLVTGGTAAAYKDACFHLRKCGTLVCVGLPKMGTGAVAGAEPLLVAVMKWSIKGSLISSLSDVNEALEFAARGAVKPHLTTYPFEQWPQMNRKLAASQIAGRAVMFFDD